MKAFTIVAALACASCSSNEGPAKQAVRTAAFVIQSLCAPTATVQECADTLLERAAYLAGDGGSE